MGQWEARPCHQCRRAFFLLGKDVTYLLFSLNFFSALPTPPNEHFLPEDLGIQLLTFQQQQEYFIPFQRFAVCMRAWNF